MSSIDTTLAMFDPITLDSANEIAELQTRIDRKYLVDVGTLGELLSAFAPEARVLEIDGERSCQYRSTYFDTEDLALYRAAAQGRRRRFKVRSRRYGSTGPCFLEVKSKGRHGANVKTRIHCTGGEHDTITPLGFDFLEATTGAPDIVAALQPTLGTEYERTTLIDPRSGTRLTFDRQLRCTDLAGDVRRESALDGIVLETKSAGAASPADQWLWRHHVRPSRLSKYCTGLGAVRPDLRANKWHRIIDRHWHVAMDSPSMSTSR